jgi:DNA recombination protein RmuC
MLYLIAIIALVVMTTAFYGWVKYFKLRMKYDFLEQHFSVISIKSEGLQAENIAYIKQIEGLISKAQYQQNLIDDFNRLRKESNEFTKAALFEMGNELSKQLLELHKQENKDSQERSQQHFKETVEKFNSEFERVVHMVGSLNKEIAQSKDTVDLIKNSLLSPSGAGYLAEITLENLLKGSALRPNLDFIMQYSVHGEESGTYARPDSVIFLPSNKVMVVDAKASKFLLEEQEDNSKLARTMNNHLRSLASKGYADLVRKDLLSKDISVSNVVVLMFLPSEHAVERLLDADREFLHKAWQQNIFVVGPTGLMNILSLARFQIAEQMMLENHLKIIEEVKTLLNSIGVLTTHSAKLGSSIMSLVSNYDKFAQSFNKNFLSKARKLNDMGIEGGKKNNDSLKSLHLFMAKNDIIDLVHQEDAAQDNKEEQLT